MYALSSALCMRHLTSDPADPVSLGDVNQVGLRSLDRDDHVLEVPGDGDGNLSVSLFVSSVSLFDV